MSRVLLVGLPGAGKSAVGAALSARTGWPYLDDGALIERTAGCSAAALLQRDGEAALRAAEQAVLTVLLGMPDPVVAGVPSGAVLDPGARERVACAGHVVYLKAGVPALLRRLGGATAAKQVLGDDPAAVLKRLSAERCDLYSSVAHQVVDTDVLPVPQVARRILDVVRPAP